MTLSEELRWRGFINQTTLTDLSQLDTQKWTFYHGFDASADSQTVGNLAAMMLDKVFMRHGHKAIILAGGATSLIGDPGGKDSERVLQDEVTITANITKAEEQLKRVLAGHEFQLVNNLEWTKDMTVITFLRDIGKHFSMTPLVQRDYIAKRLGEGGSGISYTEFSYTLLQGMDYLHLFDKFGVTLQLGGSDQWGNCLSGLELVRRARAKEVHVLTHPLVVNAATGAKFGKTEAGAIWLDAAKTSVYQFYQFWLNSDDSVVESYLKIFTELDKETIAKIMQEFQANRADRQAQKTLAYEVTKLVHGQVKADSVLRVTNALFGTQGYSDLSAEDITQLKQELPVGSAKIGDDPIQALVMTVLASSNSEARRFLEQGSIYVNGVQVDGNYRFEPASLLAGKQAILRLGKNKNAIIRII